MSILWWGTELADFNVTGFNLIGKNSLFSTGVTDTRRSEFVRGSMDLTEGGYITSADILSPAVTSIWLKFVAGMEQQPMGRVGLIKSGTDAFIGVMAGDERFNLVKYDGTTVTTLINSATNLYRHNRFHRVNIDIQITNYNDTNNGNVKYYIDGKLDGEYTGDLTVLSQTSLDQFFAYNASGIYSLFVSEVVIADEDTRLMYLRSHEPESVDTFEWDGDSSVLYSVPEELNDDGNAVGTDTAEEDIILNTDSFDREYNTIGLNCVGLKINFRAINGNSGNIGLQTGIKTNGVIHLGSTQDFLGDWINGNEVFLVNPETSNPFTWSELDAFQIVFRSKTQ